MNTMMDTGLMVTGITAHLRNSRPNWLRSAPFTGRHDSIIDQWEADVNAMALWLEATVDEFDRAEFLTRCYRDWPSAAIVGRPRLR